MTPPDHRLPLAALFLIGTAIGACLFRNVSIALTAAVGALAVGVAILVQFVRTLNREKRS
ncbi:hypothetical protein [Sphingomonas sp. IW22]|uniref:hypothetical protein n=1 Tax=Sphingomonas sp. IW22 TaxID=3242489 RepID=UPI003521986F